MKKLLAMALVTGSVIATSFPAAAEIVNVTSRAEKPTRAEAVAELTRRLEEESCGGRGGTPASAVTITYELQGPVSYIVEGGMACDIP